MIREAHLPNIPLFILSKVKYSLDLLMKTQFIQFIELKSEIVIIRYFCLWLPHFIAGSTLTRITEIR